MQLERSEWVRVFELLDQALDLPEPERAQWLQTLPPLEPRIAGALRELLAQAGGVETGFLAQGARLTLPGPDAGRDASAAADADWQPGMAIGPWRLLRPLGRGGMASVWLAERADGAHRREVALKLPDAGAGTPRARAIAERFARERTILSLLRHPHIAQVLDAGAQGAQPWLALEFVDGAPITAFADQRALDLRARLQLFVPVLRAVQHAHAQLVIHRDVKPANVMVDQAGQVKLLDFGVAKLLEPDGAAPETALTRLGGRAMTPQYASPEQIAGAALTTASDVYSLGVLLYELLTGRLPYTLARASAAALEEAIAGAEVLRPSQAVADARRARALRGDVDTLVMKAMRLDPAQRYASAEAFAEDIERHLAHLPIRATPGGVGYRLRKLWARRRLPIVAGALVTLALLAGLGGALWQAHLAQAQAQRAEAVQQFLATTLGGNDPELRQGRTLSARELLDRSAARIDADFAQQPGVRARLHETVARLYNRMGDMLAALSHAERAAALLEADGQAGSLAHRELLILHNESLVDLARWADARAVIERTLALGRQRDGERDALAPRLRSQLAYVAVHEGRTAEALELGESALAQLQAAGGEQSIDYLKAANNLAQVCLRAGLVARAAALHQRIVELGARLPGYDLTDRLVDRGNLGQSRFVLGDVAGAEAVLGPLMPEIERHLGAAHDRTITLRGTRSLALAELGRIDEALREQRANLAAAEGRAIAGDEAPVFQRAVLGRVLRLAGRVDEALPLSLGASEEFDRRYAQPTWLRERARWMAAEALIGTGRSEQGLQMLDQAVAAIDRLMAGRRHWAPPEGALVQAVATRASDPAAAQARAERACQALHDAGPEGEQRLPRCRALAAWLGALAAADVAGARQRFVAARTDALARLPEHHALRAELAAAEAEILQRDPAAAAQAETLLRDAGQLHQQLLGVPLPAPLRLVH